MTLRMSRRHKGRQGGKDTRRPLTTTNGFGRLQ